MISEKEKLRLIKSIEKCMGNRWARDEILKVVFERVGYDLKKEMKGGLKNNEQFYSGE